MNLTPRSCRLACSLALSFLPACFGTGVTPATQTSLSFAPSLEVRAGETFYLDIKNTGRYSVVAKNVRLRLEPPGPDQGLSAADALSFSGSASCAALSPGDVCTFAIAVAPNTSTTQFPQLAHVLADNADGLPLQLLWSTDAGGFLSGLPGLSATNVRLKPPAPAASTITLTNTSSSALLLEAPQLTAAANVTFDTSTCTGFPKLAAHSQCKVLVRAPNDAVPGSYLVTVPFSRGTHRSAAQLHVTVVPGTLVLNEGAPLFLDSNTTVLPVSVRNTGFDVGALNLDLPWSGTCRGEPSLTVDAADCLAGLGANARCTLRVRTLGATPGASSQLTLSVADDSVAPASAPVQVGSLAVHGVTFSAPGTQLLTLENLASTQLSVLGVRVGGDRADGLAVPTGPQLAACQNFSGTCQVPISADANAFAQSGASILTVTYAGAPLVQQASGDVTVAPVPITVHAGLPVRLSADASMTAVTLRNDGAFAWVSPTVAVSPPIAGLSVATDCPAYLAAGASCNAHLTVGYRGPTGVSAQLIATGANAAAGSAVPLRVDRALLLVGQDSGGAGLGQVSYDGDASLAATWQPSVALPGGLSPQKAALSPNVWVVVGSVGGNQGIATSQDRGHTWQLVALDGVMGVLHDVAVSSRGFVAVGTDAGTGAATIRSSSDGLAWSLPRQALGPAVLHAVSCNAGSCVAVGSGSSVSGGMALHSSDGGNVWQPNLASATGPAFAGTLYAAANSGQGWALGGNDGSNKMAVLTAMPQAAGPYDTTAGVLSATGSVRALAYSGAQWLAVGEDAGTQRVNVSVDVAAQAWNAAASNIGNGALYGLVWVDNHWAAAGVDTGTGTAVVRMSQDGTSWTATTNASAIAWTAIAAAP